MVLSGVYTHRPDNAYWETMCFPHAPTSGYSEQWPYTTGRAVNECYRDVPTRTVFSSVSTPFQVICTPMHNSTNATIRRMP
jgi:hypothetical protein